MFRRSPQRIINARAATILKELIETDTTHSAGSTTVAAERMAARLVAAGFPKADVVVVGSSEKAAQARGNLVARYRGAGRAQARPLHRPPRRRRGAGARTGRWIPSS